ncbi:hypothetical protein PMIN03_012457 [Paraphaeosphaeria minitans]
MLRLGLCVECSASLGLCWRLGATGPAAASDQAAPSSVELRGAVAFAAPRLPGSQAPRLHYVDAMTQGAMHAAHVGSRLLVSSRLVVASSLRRFVALLSFQE